MVFVDLELEIAYDQEPKCGGDYEREESQKHTLKSFKTCMKTVKHR